MSSAEQPPDVKGTALDADRVISVLGDRLAGLVGRAHADEIVRNAQLEVLAATLIAQQVADQPTVDAQEGAAKP